MLQIIPMIIICLKKKHIMRRNEREIKDRQEIEAIIQRAEVCRVGFSENNTPYIVPMNFGYKDNCLYFHCAAEGRKLDIIRRNNTVCFEIDIDYELVKSPDKICSWGAKYRSVMGSGKAFIIGDTKEKSDALNIITRHYGAGTHDFSGEETEKINIIKVLIENMTGKKTGY